ncbi:uncharacterized protein [Narcine bancroftii]|uniref:uncharacterized protein n=1 Tax=Narcine bancroftii TaxID=1343680 RepID=UPI0038322D4B
MGIILPAFGGHRLPASVRFGKSAGGATRRVKTLQVRPWGAGVLAGGFRDSGVLNDDVTQSVRDDVTQTVGPKKNSVRELVLLLAVSGEAVSGAAVSGGGSLNGSVESPVGSVGRAEPAIPGVRAGASAEDRDDREKCARAVEGSSGASRAGLVLPRGRVQPAMPVAPTGNHRRSPICRTARQVLPLIYTPRAIWNIQAWFWDVGGNWSNEDNPTLS